MDLHQTTDQSQKHQRQDKDIDNLQKKWVAQKIERIENQKNQEKNQKMLEKKEKK